MKETYGELWDEYVVQGFARQQEESGGELSYPGEEWGSEASWNAIFDRLFVASDVGTWRHAIEIGGGGGKYTQRVLDANADVRVWGFDVSRNFLTATAERLDQHVSANRLMLNEIDSVHPDAMLRLLENEGLGRKVDAMFSIDAMVHVDLQYLVTYWITAALVLRKGGRILMTLADPTSEAGFQKLIRDIRKFYRYQGRICPKFEYLDRHIVSHILQNLGFEIESLEHWSYRPGAPARDIYLIARLESLERAENFRAAISSAATFPMPAKIAPAEKGAGKTRRASPQTANSRPAEAAAKPGRTGSVAASGPGTGKQRNPAQAIGRAYWRTLTMQANPDLTRDQLKELLRQSWGGAQQEYSRLGLVVLRQLRSMGYDITRVAPDKGETAPAGKLPGNQDL